MASRWSRQLLRKMSRASAWTESHRCRPDRDSCSACLDACISSHFCIILHVINTSRLIVISLLIATGSGLAGVAVAVPAQAVRRVWPAGSRGSDSSRATDAGG
jgi:hypothetical protein